MKIILTDQFYKATGIKGSYYAQMRFFAYYCNDNKIDTEYLHIYYKYINFLYDRLFIENETVFLLNRRLRLYYLSFR